MKTQAFYGSATQRGAVLFVGLIMLIIITLMGVVAMKSSILQEKLSAGAMDQSIAFQAAESALRDAEKDTNQNLTSSSAFTSACTGGLCLPSSTATQAWQSINDWTTSALPIAYGTNTGEAAISGVAIQPRYIIELLPDIPVEPGGSAGSTPNNAFRITAMGWGKRASTPIMLQSIYIKK